jgi:adenylate cyclase
MTYGQKLTAQLVAVAIFSAGISIGLSYFEFRRLIFDELRQKALSIAATTASFVDGDAHREVKTREDESSSNYIKLVQQLRRARDVNRLVDEHVKFVYTMRHSPSSANVLEFVVDAEESIEEFSHVGDIYKGKTENPTNLEELQADNNFTVDQWGEFLSATAPIKDSSGKFVGAVGVDIAAEGVRASLARVAYTSLASLGISLTFAFGLSWILSARAAKPIYALRELAEAVKRGDLDARTAERLRGELGEVADSMAGMAVGLKERERIQQAFGRYVSREVLQRILSNKDLSRLSGDRRRVTILFADIKGFTSIAESLAPEEVVNFLNSYFSAMIEIIFRNHGTLDKFIGDGLMVIFGAPVDDQFQEEHAIQAAIEMQRETKRICEDWLKQGRPPIQIGIGINSGNAVVGTIGSETRMEYTAIGDAVNVAARIESMTRNVEADILMTDRTYEAVRHVVSAKSLGNVQVKGRTQLVHLYSVIGLKEKPELVP